MTFLRFLLACALLFGLMGLASPSVHASYESPNFAKPPFETDGLSLADNEREEVVNALAALALNFPGDDRVDDDLREKALGIALTLDPLSGAARSAHEALLEGDKPETVDFFTSLNSITKALWRHGEKLAARDAEPDDRKLAPYLMEIALVLKSGPEPEEVWQFGVVADFRPINWDTFVSLQGSAFDSNLQAQLLMREAKDLRKGAPKTVATPSPSPPGNGGRPKAKGTKGKGEEGQAAEIKQRQTALRFAAVDTELGAVPGEARLNIRRPTNDERSLFGMFVGSDGNDAENFVMRLVWDRDGPTVAGYETASELIKATWPHWPKNLVGEYSFQSAGPSSPSQLELSLACTLLLEAAFTGATIPPEIAVAGAISEEGAIEFPGSAAKLSQAAGIGGGSVVKVLLMPEAAELGLNDAVTAGDLSVLVRPQVISFSDYDDLKTLVFGPRPEQLEEAIGMFEEIQNLTVSQSMTLDGIAKNPAVQDRLKAITELCPGHLSAKLMLTYGAQPADMQLSPAGSVGQIDGALKPVAKYYTDSVFGGGAVVGAAEKLVDQARNSLRELRPKVHADAGGCLNSAERTLEAFDEYFSLTNKSSSRAAQLRRELQEAINELNSARNKLGVTENISL